MRLASRHSIWQSFPNRDGGLSASPVAFFLRMMFRVFVPLQAHVGTAGAWRAGQNVQGAVIGHLFNDPIPDRDGRLQQPETAGREGALEGDSTGELTGLFKRKQPPRRCDGLKEVIQPGFQTGALFKVRLGGRILATFEGLPVVTGKPGVALRLDEGMRRDDDVVGSRERSVLDVQALEAEVPQPERPRAFAGHPQRGVRTVHAHDGDSRELLGIERRQQADAAPEIKDGPGSAESFSDGRPDGLVVVVLLTVEDRQYVRSRGVVVKGYFSCDAGTRGSFLLDKPIQSGKVLRAERFSLPTEKCVVGLEWSKPPPIEMMRESFLDHRGAGSGRHA